MQRCVFSCVCMHTCSCIHTHAHILFQYAETTLKHTKVNAVRIINPWYLFTPCIQIRRKFGAFANQVSKRPCTWRRHARSFDLLWKKVKQKNASQRFVCMFACACSCVSICTCTSGSCILLRKVNTSTRTYIHAEGSGTRVLVRH